MISPSGGRMWSGTTAKTGRVVDPATVVSRWAERRGPTRLPGDGGMTPPAC